MYWRGSIRAGERGKNQNKGAPLVFNSLTFLVFFAIVLALHRLPLPWTAKKFNLLIASYVFYAAWNPPFILLLWVSTIVDWYIARGIYASRDKSRARTPLLAR